MAGYSGTPLAKKLGIKSGAVIWVFGAPEEYRSWLAPLPEDVSFASRAHAAGCDIAHLFVTNQRELEKSLPKARDAIKPDGAIWVSWYKKSAKIPTDVTEDTIRNLALKGDLVDVKVCAVSEVWSGLKLVVRKHLR